MKYKVEVDEIVWAVNTYIVEAESEDAIRIDLMEGIFDGIIEQTETYSDTKNITNIRSITPIAEEHNGADSTCKRKNAAKHCSDNL